MFQYQPHFIPTAIYVIGCGGTGSRLVPLAAQLVKTTMRSFNPMGWIASLPIFLVDDDIVEHKNLMRQNFIEQDVGQHKASVLANRYSRGFGVPVYPCTERVTTATAGLPIIGYPDEPPRNNIILILAVDSPEARRDILKSFFRYARDIFVIDAGNEDTFGQVRFFTDTALLRTESDAEITKHLQNLPKMVPTPFTTKYIPFPGEHYENLGSSASEKSCADLDQTLSINAMMATLMCGVLQNFLYVKPMNYNEVRYSLNGSITTTYNSPENWLRTRIGGYGRIVAPGQVRDVDALSGFRNHVVADLRKMNIDVSADGSLVPIAKVVEEVKPVKKRVTKRDPELAPL